MSSCMMDIFVRGGGKVLLVHVEVIIQNAESLHLEFHFGYTLSMLLLKASFHI